MKKLYSLFLGIIFLQQVPVHAERFEPVYYPSGPVITPGFQAPYDSNGVLDPELIWDGRLIRMYYTAIDMDGVQRIALATSGNLTDWYPAGIILEPVSGTFDRDGAGSPDILFVNEHYYLFYTATSSGFQQIAVTISTDGFDFSGPRHLLLGPSYVNGSFDQIGVSDPSVIFDNNRFYMFYRGYDGSPWWRLGLAESDTGLSFMRVNGNGEAGETFGRGPHGFDDGGAGEPDIWIGDNGSIRMLYTSNHY